MRTKEVIQDLLLSNSDNKEWFRNVLISSHIISRNELTDYNDRNFFEKERFNYLEIKNGVFKNPIVLTIISKTITVFIIERNFKDKNKRIKRCIKIIGDNCEFKNFTMKSLLKEASNQDKKYGYLKENDFTILYFPFLEDDPTGDVFIFQEVMKDCFLIDSLSKNVNSNEYKKNLRSGFTKKEVIQMILDEFYDS